MRTEGTIKRAAVIAAMSAAAFALVAGQASAAVVDNDRVRLSTGAADFGSGIHVGGGPSNYGNVAWSQSSSTISARTTGTVYWDSIIDGGCARVVVGLYNSQGSLLDKSYSKSVCRQGAMDIFNPTPPQRSVDLTLSAVNGHRLKVTTQQAVYPGTTWRDVAATNAYLGDD